jgi:hypothetical protein
MPTANFRHAAVPVRHFKRTKTSAFLARNYIVAEPA